MQYLYVMISRTHTKFGSVIRKFGRVTYNHSAISFDKGLTEMYGFARKRHKAVLTATLVHESIPRYTMNKPSPLDVVIFRIPVNEEQYVRVRITVNTILNDSSYVYNLFSVLSYPVTGGFNTYKAFSCIEFTMYILRMIGFRPDKPLYSYKPDDLLAFLGDYIYYQGDLRDYIEREINADTDYFLPISGQDVKESVINILRLVKRLFIQHT